MPLILDFLKDDEWSVRDAGKKTLVKLSEQGKIPVVLVSRFAEGFCSQVATINSVMHPPDCRIDQ
jgi:hypothetical protein